MLRRILIAVFALAAVCALPCVAGAQTAAPSTTPIKVGTRIIPPFVMRDGAGKLTGFSIDLWEALARETGIAQYEYVVADNVAGILSDVAAGRTKLAIAAISITADREKTFDFSQPMADGGLKVAVPFAPTGDADPVSSFLSFVGSKSFLEILAGVMVLMLIPAPFIWLIERNTGEDLLQAKSKFGQLGQAIWWSVCALGGQAQDMPSRVVGRIIAVPWLMFAVLFSSYFTAAVTARMTVRQLEQNIAGPDDLAGKTVAVVAGTTGADWLKLKAIRPLAVATVDEALKAVVSGTVSAAVYDEPVLAYMAGRDMKDRIKLVGPTFEPRHYGVVFLPNAPERRPIDEALLRLRESGEYHRIEQKYFGSRTD